jgi:hypothetical protein
MAEYIAIIRVSQLVLASIIGFSCIYLGYRLFAQIPISATNDGHFKMPKLGEVKLKAAPGVFFAVLGAAIVYFSVNRSIDISREQVAAKPTTASSSATTAPQVAAKPTTASSSATTAPPQVEAPSPPAGDTFHYSQQREPPSPKLPSDATDSFRYSNMPRPPGAGR